MSGFETGQVQLLRLPARRRRVVGGSP